MSKRSDEIEAQIGPLLEKEGFELVEVVIGNHNQKTLVQFFIDKPSGISLSDCETASDKISAVLDMEELIKGAYVLEVSSPGIYRSLRKPEHFRRFTGERVKITLKTPLNGLGFYTGVILSAGNDAVTINDGTNNYTFEYSNIRAAKLDPVVDFK